MKRVDSVSNQSWICTEPDLILTVKCSLNHTLNVVIRASRIYLILEKKSLLILSDTVVSVLLKVSHLSGFQKASAHNRTKSPYYRTHSKINYTQSNDPIPRDHLVSTERRLGVIFRSLSVRDRFRREDPILIVSMFHKWFLKHCHLGVIFKNY